MPKGNGCHYVKQPACPHARGRSWPSYKPWRAKLQALRPGETIVYHLDREARDPGVFAAVWDEYALERPAVIPLQRRRKDDGRLTYLAIRR